MGSAARRRRQPVRSAETLPSSILGEHVQLARREQHHRRACASAMRCKWRAGKLAERAGGLILLHAMGHGVIDLNVRRRGCQSERADTKAGNFFLVQ